MTDEELAKAIFHKVLDDLTDRRSIRQSPLEPMKMLMRHGDESDELYEAAKECEQTNIDAIVALLRAERPT